MGIYKAGLTSFLMTLMAVLVSGCGQETLRIPDTTRPVVVSTSPVTSATGVPFGQIVNATFSKAMNPTTINSTSFTLTAGGVAVAGTVSYSATGSVASFTPAANLAPATLFTATITTAAQDTATPANSLAANYTWSFTTPAVVVPPTVLSTTPANAVTGVSLTQTISATFSTAMNPATVNGTTFTLSAAGGMNVTGAVTYAGATATFVPGADLATNTLYTATITTGAQDVAGDALAANYTWVFKTGMAAGAPAVIATNPVNNATGVPTNQAVTATFNEAVNPATVTAATFKVSGPGGVAVAGTVAYVGGDSVAIFTPSAFFAPNTLFTATITTGVTDLSGTALTANYVWTFTSGAAPDVTPPVVRCTDPVNNATGVAVNQVLDACFSKAMNPISINADTFTLTAGGVAVAGLVTYTGGDATFTPTSDLARNTVFTATITTGAKDLSGNALAANYVWTFTTGDVADTTPPTIVLTNPLDGATAVAANQTISATFSEAMDPVTLTNSTFTLSTAGEPAVPATVSYDAANFIVSLTPTTPLAPNTTYTATVTAAATDLAGNPLGAGTVPNPWTFTTGTQVLPPVVPLGTAALFGGMGGLGVTNTGTKTVVNGDIGTIGASTTVTGFHDVTPDCVYTETPLNIGAVNGTIYTGPPPPTMGCPDEGTGITSAVAVQAEADALTAYTAFAGIPGGKDVSTCAGCGGGLAGELGARTLAPGIYKSASGSYAISLGDLTLDAHGDANASWVFQMDTTLTVGTPSAHRNVLLINGAQAKNVSWQVGTTASINGSLGGGTMEGTVIAQSGVSVSTAGANAVTTMNGRVLALDGPVTLVNTVINVPAP